MRGSRKKSASALLSSSSSAAASSLLFSAVAATRGGALSLPLLEGLCRRPGEPDRVVQEVFSEWNASVLIARYCDSRWNSYEKNRNIKRPTKTKRSRGKEPPTNAPPPSKRRRRGGKKNKEEEQSVKPDMLTTIPKETKHFDLSLLSTPPPSSPSMSTPSQHWLVQSLASASVQDRQVACKILMQGCPLDNFSLHTCITILSHLIHTANPSSSHIASSTVGWIAILKHLVVNVLSANERLAFCYSRKIGITSICTTLWKLVLLEKKNGQQQQHSHPLLRVCLSLVDLLHALVLNGSNMTVHEIHGLMWSKVSETQNSPPVNVMLTSPLECLVATYHLWRDNFRHNKSLDKYLQLLKQLIDPSLLPKASPSDSYRDKNRDLDGRDRLSMTFSTSASRASKPASTTDSSPDNAGAFTTSSSGDYNPQTSGVVGSSDASAVAALLESSPENRSVMDSVSRLLGSLYSSNEEEQNRDNDHGHGDQFESMMETEYEDVGDEDDDGENAEEEQPKENQEEVEDEDADNDEGEEEDLDQASSDEENDDGDVEDEEKNVEEEDEEIDSDEMEEVEDDDEAIIIHDDDLPGLEQGLLEFQRGLTRHTTSTSSAGDQPSASSGPGLQNRSRQYVQAAMKVLSIQHPAEARVLPSKVAGPVFSISAEKALVTSILNIVKPQKKPFDGKICLRRAPTQEEFFRGSLSRNPVSLSMLAGNSQQEPTVRSLRQHIATELQMADSAEMLELLIGGKILDVDLKLRVVNQTLWKEHCIQLAHSSSGSALSSLLGGGRSVSLMVTSSFGRSLGTGPSLSLTVDSPMEHFPPMIMTYRLVGVDGEATEDTVATLSDPEAPSEASSPEERERLMEEQFGITRLATKGRGVVCLIRSLEAFIYDNLRKIRRDDVEGIDNPSHFGRSTYCGLTLLTCCAKLSSNRRLLLNARAPTSLLRLLLDVLHALQGDSDGHPSESNSTAKDLKELIEVLAQDISGFSSGASQLNEMEEDDDNEAASTLRQLIQDIEASTLSPPLRNIIARLLPYLTYGKPKLSKELATEFMSHVRLSQLGDYDEKEAGALGQTQSVLMDTFIHASMSLPSNEVCDSLRVELLNCGFVERIAEYLFQKCPLEPPSWHAFLWPKEKQATKQKQLSLEKQWREYSKRPGLKSCFDILVGLSKEHRDTQVFLAEIQRGNLSFFRFCHWLESTSDHPSAGISVKKLALVAEALLDDLVEFDSLATMQIRSIRKATRERKKEIAMERRNKTLSKFGSSKSPKAFVFGLLSGTSGSSETERPGTSTPSAARKKKVTQQEASKKPAWMEEMDSLVDETGLVCSVCQEGLENQPQSLLGIYVWAKRVTLSSSESRIRTSGATLLTALPTKLPESIQDPRIIEWYQSGRAAGNEVKYEVASAGINRKRDMSYTTTVSTCNAIHLTCHERARIADRNHPKAPKSEWEGASLRNSRANCNVILPLVSSRSSRVSLGAVEQALTSHQSAIANMMGVQPKSNLWTVLHDVRLLLLRMAYGEPLNSDCGGGSLFSNSQLLFYQLAMANSFDLEAQVDSPSFSLHARAISAGFLAAREIISAKDYSALSNRSLIRGAADSSTMAPVTAILFHNTYADGGLRTEAPNQTPHPKRRWAIAKEQFLRGLINCAGCRHALGLVDSGCSSGRSAGSKRNRSTAFAEWGTAEDAEESKAARTLSGQRGKTNSRASIDDFGQSLRPLLIFYAMIDQLSSDYSPDLDDPAIDEAASRFVRTIESCYRSKNIHELLEKANVTLSHSEIINDLQQGMTAA